MAVKQPQPKMHLTQYLYVLKRRWVLVVMFWVVIFAGVTVVTYTQDPQYKAEAELMIGSTYAAPESMETQTSGLSAEFFNSQYRIIRSRDVAKKLYNHFQYYNKQVFRDLAPDQDPYAIVQKWILVTPVPKSQNVKVWTVMPDPDEGHRFVNKVCDLYLEFVAEQKKQTLEKSQSVLAQRIDQILRNIEETNRDIQVFSKQHDIYVLPDIRSAILERQNWLQEAVGAASIDNVTRWTDSLEISKAIDEGQPLDIRDNDLLERLREKSHALAEAKRIQAGDYTEVYLERAGAEDRINRALRIRIEETEKAIVIEEQRLREARKAEAIREAATALANLSVLNKMLEINQEQLAATSQNLLTLDGYRKKQESLEEIRKILNQALENVKTYKQYDEVDVNVIAWADVPKEQYSPRPLLNMSLGGLVGLMVGVGAAYFFEYLNTTIRMPRDIEDGLGLPVLGFVPAMSPRLKDFPTRSLISHLDSGCGPAEAFRGIRTEIMLRSELRHIKTIMITSTSPQEGKTTVAVNMAITLAQAGNKVLLVDADLRKPVVHTAFNLKADQGLSTLLAEKESATVYIKKTQIENLHVLPGGPVPMNPAELLTSRKMRTLVAEAAERYDTVVIDASPVLGVADANILSTMVDCVVLVVQASRSRRGLVMRAKNQLASVNARLAGAVLNNVRGAKGDYYYYRQYYRSGEKLSTES